MSERTFPVRRAGSEPLNPKMFDDVRRSVAWEDDFSGEALIIGDLTGGTPESIPVSYETLEPAADGSTVGLLLYADDRSRRQVNPEARPWLVTKPMASALTPYERYLVTHVDGERTIDDLMHAGLLAPAEITAAILTLVDRGILSLAPSPVPDPGRALPPPLPRRDAEAGPPPLPRTGPPPLPAQEPDDDRTPLLQLVPAPEPLAEEAFVLPVLTPLESPVPTELAPVEDQGAPVPLDASALQPLDDSLRPILTSELLDLASGPAVLGSPPLRSLLEPSPPPDTSTPPEALPTPPEKLPAPGGLPAPLAIVESSAPVPGDRGSGPNELGPPRIGLPAVLRRPIREVSRREAPTRTPPPTSALLEGPVTGSVPQVASTPPAVVESSTSSSSGSLPAVSRPPRAPVRVLNEQESKAAKLYDAALADQSAGKHVSALMNIKLAIAFDPKDSRYSALFKRLSSESTRHPGAGPRISTAAQELFEQGCEAESHGDVDEAIRHFAKALQIAKDPAIMNRLGVILATRKGSFRKAQRLLQQAVDLDPSNLAYLHNLEKILSAAALEEGDAAAPPTPGLAGKVAGFWDRFKK